MEYSTVIASFFNGKESFLLFGGKCDPQWDENCRDDDILKITPSQPLGSLLTTLLNDTAGVASILYTQDELAGGLLQEHLALAEECIAKIRKYIDFCEQKQIPYRILFNFLWNNGYFPNADIVPPESWDEYDMTVLWDDECDRICDDLDLIYQHIVEHSKDNAADSSYKIHADERIVCLALISLQEIVKSGKQFKKCKNCGKYFIPENRTDTLYCNNPCPQEATMSCKEFSSRRLWYERQKADEIATLAKNILSAKAMLAKRNPDIPKYKKDYELFREERKAWKKAVEAGQETREAYKEWLLSHKRNK